VKKLLKSVHIYGSYRKIKTGVPFFGTPGRPRAHRAVIFAIAGLSCCTTCWATCCATDPQQIQVWSSSLYIMLDVAGWCRSSYSARTIWCGRLAEARSLTSL